MVAPSRWYETGPLTVYEGLAAGVPVIASSLSGAAEKVIDGQTGLVVRPKAEDLAEAFRRLANLETVRRMGQAGYERYWSAPLSPEAHALWLTEVYAGMLAASAPMIP